MLRRLFLFGGVGASASAGDRLPSGLMRLNAFAEAYNKYIQSLNQGLLDVRLRRRVREAWGRLNG
jgi:hypothetical protein